MTIEILLVAKCSLLLFFSSSAKTSQESAVLTVGNFCSVDGDPDLLGLQAMLFYRNRLSWGKGSPL